MSKFPSLETKQHAKPYPVAYDDSEELVSALSPELHLVTGGFNDFKNAQLVSIEDSSPVSPPSESPSTVQSSPATEHSSPASCPSQPKHLMPLTHTTVQCCRCDHVGGFLDEWDPYTGEHRAVCSKCTSAFCTKCRIDPAMNVIIFKDNKAHLPSLPDHRIEFFFLWFCTTCGRSENIPADQVRHRSSSFVTINPRSFRCEPCAQKASNHSVFLATSTSPNMRQPPSYESIVEEQRLRLTTPTPAAKEIEVASSVPPMLAKTPRSRSWSSPFKRVRRLTSSSTLSKQGTI